MTLVSFYKDTCKFKVRSNGTVVIYGGEGSGRE